MQHAGALLTPRSFWQGLLKQPYRAPDPVWSIGGGYREDDFTYQDYVSVNWWDPTGRDPSGSGGAWCNVEHGRRYSPGDMPVEPFPWFDRTACITQPPAGVQG